MERVLHVMIQGYKWFRKAFPQSCHLTHPAELSKDLFTSVGRAWGLVWLKQNKQRRGAESGVGGQARTGSCRILQAMIRGLDFILGVKAPSWRLVSRWAWVAISLEGGQGRVWGLGLDVVILWLTSKLACGGFMEPGRRWDSWVRDQDCCKVGKIAFHACRLSSEWSFQNFREDANKSAFSEAELRKQQEVKVPGLDSRPWLIRRQLFSLSLLVYLENRKQIRSQGYRGSIINISWIWRPCAYYLL